MHEISLDAWRDQYLHALLAGKRRDVVTLLDAALRDGYAPTALQRGLVREAQLEVGRLWQADRITVAQEHIATAVSQVALSHLYERAQRAADNGKKVLMACVEGEQHELPARLVTDFLDLSGFTVCYLGPNVPTSCLVTCIARETPDVVGLSVTMDFNLPALEGAIVAIRAHLDVVPPIVVGGYAIAHAPQLVQKLDVIFAGNDVEEVLATLTTLTHGA